MERRSLGYTDLNLTTVGLGTWAIGGPWQYGWGVQDDRDSIETIHRALDVGINWIDTAPAYGLGHSETIIGQALRGRRGDVILATKCGRVWDDEGSRNISAQLKSWSIRKEVEDSLRRLETDCIDLYQIHWPQPDEDIEEAWEVIAALISEGKIRYAGVSNFSVGQVERAGRIAPVASHQPPYSIFERKAESGLLQYCSEHAIGVIAYSPMQAGLLTGKFSKPRLASLPDDDWRHANEHFQQPLFDRHLLAVEQLVEMAHDYGRSIAELALAWVMRRTEITAAIVGARRPSQIEETFTASGWHLPLEAIERIDTILSAV